VCGQHHAPAAFTPGKDQVPIVQEAGWAPEPVWIGAEDLAPPGFDPRTFAIYYVLLNNFTLQSGSFIAQENKNVCFTSYGMKVPDLNIIYNRSKKNKKKMKKTLVSVLGRRNNISLCKYF
jgi:hypothetical protein